MSSLSALFTQISYLLAAVLFIVGLKKLSSPATARAGNNLAAVGMLLAIIATLLAHEIISFQWIIVGIILGSAAGALLAVKVQMTAMPQMVGLLNGFGGAASLLVAFSEYLFTPGGRPGDVSLTLVLSVLVGAVTFSGSLAAAAKLQEILTSKPIVYPLQQVTNALVFIAILILCGVVAYGEYNVGLLTVLAILSLVLGVLLVIPIGGADMPVVVSLMNSYSGIAGALTGFVLRNNALIITGALVGASGIILTQIMCKAMNRSLGNVIFGAFGAQTESAAGVDMGGKTVREASAQDVAIMLSYARTVVFVPGYGLAVSQAQHQVRELGELLTQKGIDVKYAVHPVAGRMPGHMNVLLAEANVPYPQLYEMEQINPDLAHTDVAVVVGANDVVNPAARHDAASPIFGMPIIEADKAQAVVVLKRSMNTGFAGIENELFYNENTRMLFGDAKKSLTSVVNEIKTL